MVWGPFDHPDICLPVYRRRAAERVVELLVATADFACSRGRSLLYASHRGESASYRSAVYRLRKQGFIAYRRAGSRGPCLLVTAAGEDWLPQSLKPRRYWEAGWNGRWYLVSYDVPERRRAYRDALRSFLVRHRMGWLHRSVWITPHDIRAEYDDLAKAAGADEYSFVFESRTVLGRRPEEVVAQAWDFDRIRDLQSWYLRGVKEAERRAAVGPQTTAAIRALVDQEYAAYRAVMEKDPLLPEELWPPGYRGPEVFRAHREWAVGTVGLA